MIYQYEDVGVNILNWVFIKETRKTNYLLDLSIQLGKLLYPGIDFSRQYFNSKFYFEKIKDGIKYWARRESKGLGRTRPRCIAKSCELFYFIPNNDSIIFGQRCRYRERLFKTQDIVV